VPTTNQIPGQAAGNLLGNSSGTTGLSSSDPWMKLAQDAYKRSTTYADNNYRKNWEDGLRLFNSQHPRDSKYNSEGYKYRSRIFRPKTRSVIRKHEATAAQALFSNPDVLTVLPVNESDRDQAISAAITKELLQYRLTNSRKGIPWFITAVGAFQDAMTVGICASFQYWDYQTEKQTVTKQAEIMPGVMIPLEMEEDVPVVDKPCCELLSIQRLRFDPAAKWDDVVGTSPYLILEMPMYLQDVLDRMENGYGKEGKPWKRLEEKVLLEARMKDDDPVQQARDGKRENPDTVTSSVSDFDVIQVHLNFIRSGGKTVAFYSLKDMDLLTDPVPLKELFPLNEIPVTIGFCVVETHQAMPKGLAQLGSQLQQEANEVANQRLDNVKFVLNKRWIVRRGSQVDVEGILRNVPGGVTMASDVEKDVREVNWTDVTASSFQEQDRLNADFDDLEGGGLNSASVMTNRRMNETVGGMKMMGAGSNMLTEYTFRVWVETWLEPTLRQLAKLEQKYESDSTVLAIAAQKAKVWQHYLQSPDLDKLLDQELTININVGMGATDPDGRFQKFMQATGAYSQLVAQGPPDLDLQEVRKELYGLAGFKDSARFFNQQVDPRLVRAQQMLQQAEGTAQKIIDQHKDRIQRRERQLDEREHELNAKLNEAQQQLGLEMKKLMGEFALKAQEQQFEQKLDIQKMGMEMQKARVEMVQKEREHRQDIKITYDTAKQEMALKVFQAHMDAAIAKFEAHTKALIEAATAERETELIKDEKGEPVGSRSKVKKRG
jgi:hypothetical protein